VGLYVLSRKQGICQVFLEHWYVCSWYMDVSEMVVIMIVVIYAYNKYPWPIRLRICWSLWCSLTFSLNEYEWLGI
jgi:hypothetical protein